MRIPRVLAFVALCAAVAIGTYLFAKRPVAPPPASATTTAYYAKLDGKTLAPMRISTGPATDLHSRAFLAVQQVLAGPPSEVEAIRFPAGTIARSVDLQNGTATVDLNDKVNGTPAGGFTEDGEFKALVWTLTALPGIERVAVRIDGSKVMTLPGGHLELDEPLDRSSW